jgi:hypothetical protein
MVIFRWRPFAGLSASRLAFPACPTSTPKSGARFPGLRYRPKNFVAAALPFP